MGLHRITICSLFEDNMKAINKKNNESLLRLVERLEKRLKKVLHIHHSLCLFSLIIVLLTSLVFFIFIVKNFVIVFFSPPKRKDSDI